MKIWHLRQSYNPNLSPHPHRSIPPVLRFFLHWGKRHRVRIACHSGAVVGGLIPIVGLLMMIGLSAVMGGVPGVIGYGVRELRTDTVEG